MVLVYMVYRRGKALLLLACFVLPLEAECWWKWVGEGEHGVVPTNDDVGCDEEDAENPYIYEYVRI